MGWIDHHMLIPNGDMMIRDHDNGWVEFWFKTGRTTTTNSTQPWGVGVNGRYEEGIHNLVRGGTWQMLGSTFVQSRQNVLFRMIDDGLDWPTTDFVVFIERARLPDPPGDPYFGEVTDTTIHVAFNYNYDGGLPILEGQIGIVGAGLNYWKENTRDSVFDILYPGTEYLFMGRVRNELGWSYSRQVPMRTKRTPDAPHPIILTNARVNAVHARMDFGGRWDGGSPVLEWQIAYGLNENVPILFGPYNGWDIELPGLSPGRRYYFWGRARNAYGWGPWSVRSDVTLPAGARVRTGGEYKRALVWMKVNGVWRLAKPWSKAGGTWRGTQP